MARGTSPAMPPGDHSLLVVDRFLPQEGLHLFNRAEFFRLHAEDGGHYFQWVVDDRACATLHFTQVREHVWRSPARGTFGGLSCTPGLRPEVLGEFLAQVTDYLAGQGARKLEVLLPPAQHAPADGAVQYFLLRSQGFAESLVDLNYGLPVDQRPFAERLNHANRKRLNKCRREGFSAAAETADALPAVYAVIAENREARGFPITMQLAPLQQMQALFPDTLELYGCRQQGELVAAAICLRLTPGILYVFYWGDRPGYAQYSPVTLLAESLYEDCQRRGIALLDAGTSTLDLQLNPGLIAFKRGLGFEESLKFRLERSFDA